MRHPSTDNSVVHHVVVSVDEVRLEVELDGLHDPLLLLLVVVLGPATSVVLKMTKR